MIRLSTWMVLFWTLAEGTILIAMHWGLSRLQGSRHSKAKQIKSNQIKSNQINDNDRRDTICTGNHRLCAGSRVAALGR